LGKGSESQIRLEGEECSFSEISMPARRTGSAVIRGRENCSGEREEIFKPGKGETAAYVEKDRPREGTIHPLPRRRRGRACCAEEGKRVFIGRKNGKGKKPP